MNDQRTITDELALRAVTDQLALLAARAALAVTYFRLRAHKAVVRNDALQLGVRRTIFIPVV